MTTNQKHNSLIDPELTGNNPFLIGKKMYKSPTCNVMHFENITMASATIQTPTNSSSEEEWSPETNVNGGELEL